MASPKAAIAEAERVAEAARDHERRPATPTQRKHRSRLRHRARRVLTEAEELLRITEPGYEPDLRDQLAEILADPEAHGAGRGPIADSDVVFVDRDGRRYRGGSREFEGFLGQADINTDE